jgi:hypothetical protein
MVMNSEAHQKVTTAHLSRLPEGTDIRSWRRRTVRSHGHCRGELPHKPASLGVGIPHPTGRRIHTATVWRLRGLIAFQSGEPRTGKGSHLRHGCQEKKTDVGSMEGQGCRKTVEYASGFGQFPNRRAPHDARRAAKGTPYPTRAIALAGCFVRITATRWTAPCFPAVCDDG